MCQPDPERAACPQSGRNLTGFLLIQIWTLRANRRFWSKRHGKATNRREKRNINDILECYDKTENLVKKLDSWFFWIFMTFWIMLTDLCRRILPKIKTERAWCIFCEIIATGTWLRFENLEETGFHEKVTLKNNLSDKTCRLSFCRKRSLVLHVDCMYWNTLGLTSNFNQVISKI